MYNISMGPLFIIRYIGWHYGQAPTLLFRLWMNFLWYLGHAFSVNSLWRSLFSPWKRIVAEHKKKWDLEDWASMMLANLISRIIGAIMRLLLILVGRLLQLFLLIIGGVFYLFWFLLPWLIVGTFLYGLQLIV